MQDRTLLDLNLLEQSQNLSHRANQLRLFSLPIFGYRNLTMRRNTLGQTQCSTHVM